jgi:hypothetical protein
MTVTTLMPSGIFPADSDRRIAFRPRATASNRVVVRRHSACYTAFFLDDIHDVSRQAPASVQHSSPVTKLLKDALHMPIVQRDQVVQALAPNRVSAKQGFREFQAAWGTIQGYEAMHMIRKGQVRWVSGDDVRRHIQFIQKLFEMPA